MPIMNVAPNTEADQLKLHLDRLRDLVVDVERLAAGAHPEPSRLAAAPLLTDWRLSLCPVPCLVGVFGRQPSLTEGRLGWTADLTLHAPEFGYSRTLSKLYRLGTPAEEARP